MGLESLCQRAGSFVISGSWIKCWAQSKLEAFSYEQKRLGHQTKQTS